MKDITVLDRLTGGSSRVTIVVHTHPDGDAVGSGTAMLGYLTDIKRRADRTGQRPGLHLLHHERIRARKCHRVRG